MTGDPASAQSGAPVSRRGALKLLAANIALITAGCGKPAEEILPYVHMPERLVPGIPLDFATTLPLGGFGRGVVCSSVEGLPIKVSGNSLHPASLGATDLFGEAQVLALYDPDRSKTFRRGDEIVAFDDLETELVAQLPRLRNGDGLRLLTGPISSPTILRLITDLKQRFPNFAWHVHDPLEDRSARQGAILAFGRYVQSLPRFGDADVIVTLNADPLGVGPWQIAHARGFANRRRVRTGAAPMSRLYAFESAPTATGAKADHRFALTPDAIDDVAISLARAMGADLPRAALTADLQIMVSAAAKDCAGSKGRVFVLAGPAQSPETHAIAHWINRRLDAPISYRAAPGPDADTLDKLLAEFDAGQAKAVLISGANPAYDAPQELHVADRLRRAAFSLHHGMYRDETSALCLWHVAEPHPLERWGDLRAFDGTPSLVQPLMDPFYETRSLARLLAFIGEGADAADYDLVRATWASKGGADFESWWRKSLHDGVISGEPPGAVDPGDASLPPIPARKRAANFTLVLQPDPTLYDGSFANNAWLQECPKPLTKGVWGNTLGLSPQDAEKLGVADGDTVAVRVGGAEILAPVRPQPGHAAGVMSLALGNGRFAAGAIGNDVGSNAYALRSAAAEWRLNNVAVRKASGRAAYSTQHQFIIDGDQEEIFPTFTAATMPIARHEPPKPSLLPPPDDGHSDARWAMVIDTSSCIGCNACVLACQVENNVPVVGPDEIARNRDMHWLRIDAYQMDDGRLGFEPVPCMHCETAPCEPVCPVEASIHDSEGLNVQVYNRCIGTRFCQANCPYKVRRFNFFGYADGQEYRDLGAEVMHLHNNPNVTVRARGVMEKCTYCVQRISAARRRAEKETRPIREGDVRTACQDACPTEAIAFGNLNDKDSAVLRLRGEPQHFVLLDSLNTKPRTTYLADIRNPNPDLLEPHG